VTTVSYIEQSTVCKIGVKNLNILKCKVLSLGRNVNEDYRYHISQIVTKITYLQQKDSFEDLEIIVDEN